MDGKVALVTGAASGIGKAIATGLAREGATVVLLVRNAQRGEAAARDVRAKAPGAKLETLLCDLSSQASIRKAAAEMAQRHPRLDVLVNCAGVFVKEKATTVDGVEKTFAVNYLAYFLLTNLLLDSLKRAAPSRIVNVSSKYGGAKVDFDDLTKEKQPYSYLKSTPQTMLARVLFTQELAERLKGTGVVVNTLHPGLVADTQLLNDTGGFFRWITNTIGGTPEKGADTALWLATAPETASVTGKMFEKRKEIKTPGQGSDPAARKRLWDESVKLTKLA
jgi:NAD(P)-dependent dehydrogenase (short-subunit alcohol dehydrogenase family)